VRITLRLYGALRQAAGTRELALDVPTGTCLDDLPRILAQARAGQVPQLQADGSLTGFRVLVNGRDHFTVGGLDAVLAEGDLVTVMPFLSGG
jgi:molybdopterin converting factor small subunit